MIKNLIEITTLRDKLQKFKRQLKTIISNRKNVSIEQYTSKLSNLYNQLKSFEDENVDNINKYSDIHSMLFGLYHKIDNEQAKYYTSCKDVTKSFDSYNTKNKSFAIINERFMEFENELNVWVEYYLHAGISSNEFESKMWNIYFKINEFAKTNFEVISKETQLKEKFISIVNQISKYIKNHEKVLIQ